MKLLLDTNVLIDLVANRAPYAAAAQKLCIAAVFNDVQLWASVQSYTDAYYILRKSASEQEVKEALLEMLELIKPCSVYASDLAPALSSTWPDIEDHLVANSTKHVDANCFVTRDTYIIGQSPILALDTASAIEMLDKECNTTYETLDIEDFI